MTTLRHWNDFKAVPKNATKEIRGGRLSGKTEINPVWRMKVLTEKFGPCGVGWNYKVTDRQFIPAAGDEIVCLVDIELVYKEGDKWSDPVYGTGGSKLVAIERGSARTNDDAVKMAVTDAISVACKSLGIAADIYWEADGTKYTVHNVEHQEATRPATLTPAQSKEIEALIMAEEDVEMAKSRLKDVIRGMGYDRLSHVLQSDFAKLKQTYSEYALPFKI